MRKTVSSLLAVIAVFGFVAGCGGGGGDDDKFNFGGQWVETWTISASNIPGIAVGRVFRDTLIIVQNGNNITVTYGSVGAPCTMVGTCDPVAKTFSASAVCTAPYAGVRNDISGTGIDDDTLSGTAAISGAGRTAIGPFTANLGSRVMSTAGAGGAAGDVRTLLEALR